MFLAGDVGATKILLEVGEIAGGRWRPVLARRLAVDDFPHVGAAVGAFLKEWETAKPARARIAAGAIGVAGPAQGNRVKMTHRAWVVDGDALARRFGIPRVTVVNDLAAAAHGIDLLAPRDLVTFQPGKPDPAAPRVVLGIGTGLGVAYLTGNRGQTPVSRGAENRGPSPVSDLDAHIEGALRLHEAGRLAEAEGAYRAALAACGPDPVLNYNFAALLEDLGRKPEAAAAYEAALRADPAMADGHYNLALVYEQLGRRREAIRHMSHYRRLVKGAK